MRAKVIIGKPATRPNRKNTTTICEYYNYTVKKTKITTVANVERNWIGQTSQKKIGSVIKNIKQ